MDRKQALASLLPPAMAGALLWHFFQVSARLPARMAVHFGFDGRPNGWQSPQAFAWIAGAVLIGVNLLISATCSRLRRQLSWFVIAVQLVVTGSMTWLLWQVIDYNLAPNPFATPLGAPFATWPMLLIPGLLLGLGAWFLWTNHLEQARLVAGQGPASLVIAEEQHRSLRQLWFVAAPAIIPVVMLFKSSAVARGIAGLLLLLLAVFALFIYRGFLYRVTRNGVEVRGFGLLLGFVPRTEIRSYDVESCRPLMDFGGWGIRYTGTGKAFIWGGNKVVRIRTRQGEVMLGHRQPERLIDDLDRMMQAA
jgi:hypothetical protein